MLWQKSPQYASMPHDQYMQTNEGQRAQKAFEQWGNWMTSSGGKQKASPGGSVGIGDFEKRQLGGSYGKYSPGSAQPNQQPSQGKPYGRYAAGTSPEYMAANPDTGPFAGQTRPYMNDWRPSPPGELALWGSQAAAQGALPGKPVTQYGTLGWGAAGVPDNMGRPYSMPGGGPGNLAYAPPDQRPAPFTQTMTDWTGKQVDLSQAYGQRDAFVQSINNFKAPYAAQFPMTGAPPPKMPVNQLWGQAGDMVQGGWQNPLSGLMPTAGKFMAPPGSNVQPPPGAWY